MRRRKMTDELLARMRKMRAGGKTYREIGELLGLSTQTIHSWLVGRDSQGDAGPRTYVSGQRVERFQTAPLLPAPDPRNLTGQMMGDPLPGRSALERRRS